jgi:hypothetical protein
MIAASLSTGNEHDVFHVLRLGAGVQADPEQPAAILDKAEAHADREEDRAGRAAAGAPVPGHVPVAAPGAGGGDFAKGAAARLGGVEVPRTRTPKQSFAELKARIAKTLAFIDSVPQDGDRRQAKTRDITTGSGEKPSSSRARPT